MDLVTASRFALCALFVGAGVLHFIMPRAFDRMMPQAIPKRLHRPAVIGSGVVEVALGLLLLPAETRFAAGCGLVALLLAVLPANVSMALQPQKWPKLPPAALWLRLPLQGALVAWVLWTVWPR